MALGTRWYVKSPWLQMNYSLRPRILNVYCSKFESQVDKMNEEIVFDQRGYCNHCNNYFEQAPKILNHGPKGQKKLEELVNTIKKKGKNKTKEKIIIS